MDDSVDTSRTSVKTYVPAYQKAEWHAHADDLGMSQSEFVRTMVQAGRRGFDGVGESATEEDRSDDATPWGDALETRVLELLSENSRSWDALLEEVTADVENRLDETLEELQAGDRVRYSGRDGGYTVVSDTNGTGREQDGD